MTAANRDVSIGITLGYEGGFSNDAHDPGGATNYGITLADARHYWKADATAQDVRHMPQSVAVDIYRKRYWAPVRGDDLPAGPDLGTFDYGVNSGVSRGARALQKAVGAPADGHIGDATVSAANKADAVKTVKAICAGRLSFLHGLRTWRYFGTGWGRRVANVEARGVKMALEAANHPDITGELDKHGDDAAGDAKSSTGKAAAGPAAGGAAQGFDLSTIPHWVLLLAGIVIVAVAFFFVWKAYQHKQRAAAYAEVAKG